MNKYGDKQRNSWNDSAGVPQGANLGAAEISCGHLPESGENAEEEQFGEENLHR